MTIYVISIILFFFILIYPYNDIQCNFYEYIAMHHLQKLIKENLIDLCMEKNITMIEWSGEKNRIDQLIYARKSFVKWLA